MDKQLTIVDIANDLGVSKTTVSRAISGKGRISKATRERVMSYIEKCDYQPNIMAQSLAKSKTYNIGVVMPSDYSLVDMPFFLNCLEGLYEIASDTKYDIVMTLCSNSDITDLERIIDKRKVDGVVLMRTYLEDKAIRLLKERKVPFVTIGTTEEEGVIQVEQDNQGGCKELTSILLMKGMRKIALIGGNEGHMITKSRLKGYREAFEEAKVPVRRELIYENEENPIMIENAVDSLLKTGVDCIVCMDDSICGVVLTKLERERVSVPGDVRVASFFNSMMLKNHTPTITSLSFNTREMGIKACQILIEMIRGKTVPEKTLLDYEVVLKESTK